MCVCVCVCSGCRDVKRLYLYSALHGATGVQGGRWPTKTPWVSIPALRYILEGSLKVKLPTIWTDGKAEVARVSEEKSRRKKIREEKESKERRCRCAKR